jgi:hypothetical protein
MWSDRPCSKRSTFRRARRSASQARWRVRSHACTAIYPVELDAGDLEWLVTEVRYLSEADASDRNRVAAAVRRPFFDRGQANLIVLGINRI